MKGTISQRLYNELRWDSLYIRRWHRCLCHFVIRKIKLVPEYLSMKSQLNDKRTIILEIRGCILHLLTGLCISQLYIFSNTPIEWNLLDSDTRCSNSLAEFKRKLLSKIRQTECYIYNIYDTEGIRTLTKFSACNSMPQNEHRFRHRLNAITPLCNCRTANEDNKHFLRHCPLFDNFRVHLHGELSEFLNLDIPNLDDNFFCLLLLHGSAEFRILSTE